MSWLTKLVRSSIVPPIADRLMEYFIKLPTSNSLSDRSSWMSEFHDKKLWEMLLPGTHDSTAYRFASEAFSTEAQIASAIPSLLVNCSRTQQFTIYEQLKGGIRYLDIRVNNDRRDGQIYCSHTFHTIPFQDVLDDVSKFIRENPSEVVLFAVQADGGSSQMPDAKASAKSVLDGFLTDSIEGDETLGQLVNGRKNVLYIEEHYCGNLKIENSWNKTQDADPIKAVANCITYAKAGARSSGKLVLMALEATQFTGGTLGTIESITHELQSLGQGLEDLASFANYQTLHTFLKDSAAVAGSNVINIDFANDEVIDKAIFLNKLP